MKCEVAVEWSKYEGKTDSSKVLGLLVEDKDEVVATFLGRGGIPEQRGRAIIYQSCHTTETKYEWRTNNMKRSTQPIYIHSFPLSVLPLLRLL